MKASRIIALLAALALALCAGAAAAAGQGIAHGYPDRPLHWVVPYPPGGTTDVVARDVAQEVSQVLGTSIVVENRAGAGGQIAMNWVAKARADGDTFLVSDASLATAPSLYKHLPFDPVKDLQPVALFATVPHVVVVNPALKADSLAALIALSKQPASKIDFGSGGIGSPLHLAGEALRLETGIKWTHIPYKGASPAVVAVMANEVQVATPSLPTALPQIQAGKLRALAVMSATRLKVLPEVPTVAELGYPQAVVFGWVGLHAPAGTPPAIVQTIEAAVAKALQNPDLQQRLAQQGASVDAQTGAAYGKLVADQTRRWQRVVQAAGIKPQ